MVSHHAVLREHLAAASFKHATVAMALSLSAGCACAAEVTVAVAANFTATAKQIAAAFAAGGEHTAVLSFGSTGKLYTQIAHGAPYDVFLAADQARPKKAVDEGLALIASRFTYASGKLVLYSSDATLVDDQGEVLRSTRFARLAIANPATAPYGSAAIEVLQALGVHDGVADRLVRGDNIAQTLQFVMTKNAQLGFVALAQVIDTPERFALDRARGLVHADPAGRRAAHARRRKSGGARLHGIPQGR